MLRVMTAAMGVGILMLAGCSHSEYAVRPVPRIAAENVGKPVSRLKEAFGEPRKVDQGSTSCVRRAWLIEIEPERNVQPLVPFAGLGDPVGTYRLRP